MYNLMTINKVNTYVHAIDPKKQINIRNFDVLCMTLSDASPTQHPHVITILTTLDFSYGYCMYVGV